MTAPVTIHEPGPLFVELEGTLAAAPRGIVATLVLAVTGLLFLEWIIRATLSLALALKQPARVKIHKDGLEVEARLEILGRTLRSRSIVVPPGGLVRVTRDVLYPRFAFYAGLLALAVGSYVGVRIFVDGIHAASPSLLGVGLLVIALGIGAEFLAVSLAPSRAQRCRILFEPKKGRRFVIDGVPLLQADAALNALRLR